MKAQPFAYRSKTPEQLEQLAWDVMGGRVFGSWCMEQGESPSQCFLVLALMTEEQLAELGKADIVHVYEYMDKASERSCNGLPIFFSMQCLDRHDADALRNRIVELRAIRAERARKAG